LKNSEGHKVIGFIENNPHSSSKDIFEGISLPISYSTLKRFLKRLTDENLLIVEGKGKGTKYSVSPAFKLLQPIDIEEYYSREIDERRIKEYFNFQLIPDVLSKVNVFSEEELHKINILHNKYIYNINQLTDFEYKKELERLAIDLSWKSSQIEGNTYTLLETERLIKERETASGKTKEEASMLLNHKDAIDFMIANPDYLEPLTISKIEDIHSILTKELNVDRNIRKRRVGISGTNYKPLDNEFQILEALEEMCELVNNKHNVFEKAFLVLVLISYIQPFSDGNKRTARIVSNAILMSNKYCPLSFRTVDSIYYKKAILLFYEQNNLAKFKELFIEQFEFAVNTYF
jgi:Fic family protein